MTHVGPVPASSSTSFVEWGAVLAGAVLAVAISFVLLTFGAAIGLSATSPWPNSGVSAKVKRQLYWRTLTSLSTRLHLKRIHLRTRGDEPPKPRQTYELAACVNEPQDQPCRGMAKVKLAHPSLPAYAD